MNIKQFTPYLIALATFIIVSLAYFSPVLEGKKIFQSDIAQYKGMSKEIQDFRAANNDTEPYWTDAAFGGMPAYQVSAYYPHDYIQKLDHLIRFLPRPADYLMLYFVGFFVLMMVLKVDWKLAIIGALAFGFSTYLIIILGVGHNAKAHAIGYMPLILAGVLLVFKKKYLTGFLLTTSSVALEIAAGHIQMTYYLFFMLLMIGIVYFISALKEKQLGDFSKSAGVLFMAALISIAINANHLLPTKEYTKESTRSQSELTLTPNGALKTPTTGLSRDYITQYSYGKIETFNLFIPRFMGGSNAENIGTDTNTFHFLKKKIGRPQARDFVKQAPMYWGSQPIVAAPAYIGAVLVFLFVLSFYFVESKTRNWLLASIILALLLSWGKNFSLLTDFFIDYIPMYAKFRAVSSIQVLIELAIPILGILALQKVFFEKEIPVEKKKKAIKYATFITGGIALFFIIAGSSWFAFEGGSDANYEQQLPGITDALIQDRKDLLFNDSLRSLVLVLLTATGLWLFVKNKLKVLPTLGILGALLLYDGVSVAKRYVNKDDFMTASRVEKPFKLTEIDKEILKDKGHYRVANFSKDPMNDGSTSYFHKSIGGYHAAKPRRYQELFDYQIANSNYEVINMLNTKYLIIPNEKGELGIQKNEETYGNAWFANEILWTKTADEEIKALDSISKNKVVLNEQFKELITTIEEKDSTASIALTSYQPNEISYNSNTNKTQLAVFSEMYYPHGWKAFINGKESKIIQANYVLRALVVPKGKSEIIFKFEPEVVQKGATISLVAYLIFMLLAVLGLVFRKKYDKVTP